MFLSPLSSYPATRGSHSSPPLPSRAADQSILACETPAGRPARETGLPDKGGREGFTIVRGKHSYWTMMITMMIWTWPSDDDKQFYNDWFIHIMLYKGSNVMVNNLERPSIVHYITLAEKDRIKDVQTWHYNIYFLWIILNYGFKRECLSCNILSLQNISLIAPKR
jgi:hypothetical protein